MKMYSVSLSHYTAEYLILFIISDEICVYLKQLVAHMLYLVK